MKEFDVDHPGLGPEIIAALLSQSDTHVVRGGSRKLNLGFHVGPYVTHFWNAGH